MERSDIDEAVSLLARSQRGILLATPTEVSADSLAAALALSLALGGIGKESTLVSPSHVPTSLQFLPGTAQVQEHLTQSPEIRLELPLGGQRPSHVHWEVVEDHLRISIQPERAIPFPDAEVRVTRGSYPWDLIVTVGTAKLHTLEKTFTDHTRFFYDTPILNIDRGAANEFFGTVNLVAATQGTVAEVVADLLEALGGVNLLTTEVATCLLAGIVAGTDSFRSPTTSPKTFHIASQLVAQEADHSEIIRHLFHTHTLPELRLLGLALARLQELEGPEATPDGKERPVSLLFSMLRETDVAASETATDTVPSVFSELIEWSGERRPAALAFERRAGSFEVLVFLGRVSADDREVFREACGGVSAGPFVLVNLGEIPPADVQNLVTERLVPRLPGTSG